MAAILGNPLFCQIESSLRALSNQSRHRIQSITEVIEGQRGNIIGQIAVGQAPVRDAMNFVDDEELAEQQALLAAFDLRLS